MRRMLFVFIAVVMGASDSSMAENPGQYQKTAAAALQSQISREGKDCPDARTTYDANVCIAAVEETTQHDFDVFYRNLLALLDSANQQRVASAQNLWLQYREKTCDAIGFLYQGGTIRPSAMARCNIGLTRSHMRDLDRIYESVLHH